MYWNKSTTEINGIHFSFVAFKTCPLWFLLCHSSLMQQVLFLNQVSPQTPPPSGQQWSKQQGDSSSPTSLLASRTFVFFFCLWGWNVWNMNSSALMFCVCFLLQCECMFIQQGVCRSFSPCGSARERMSDRTAPRVTVVLPSEPCQH